MTELVIQEAVEEEISQAGDDDFAPFFLNHAYDVVIGNGVELDVNFPDQTDTRLLFIGHVDVVKFIDHGTDIFYEGMTIGVGKIDCAFILPLLKEGFCRTFDLFVRPRAVEHLLQGIAVNHTHDQSVPEADARLEAGLLVHALHVQG